MVNVFLSQRGAIVIFFFNDEMGLYCHIWATIVWSLPTPAQRRNAVSAKLVSALGISWGRACVVALVVGWWWL